jgi:tetratricopeptide (TPR) repeat protein
MRLRVARKSVIAVIVPIAILCQSPSTTAALGVEEPPELSGPAKKFTPPSQTAHEFAKIIENWKENDTDKMKASRPALSRFIEGHPSFSPAYGMRALGDFCVLGSRDYDAISDDVRKALDTLSPDTGVFGRSDLLTLRGKIQFESGHYKEALGDLESAIKDKLDEAEGIFGSGEVKPEATNTSPCVWTLGNLDRLARQFPIDYRVPVLRGLYIKFFTRFDEKYYPLAAREFQKAAVLNPRSPLPDYFMGRLYNRATLLTKAAASDEGRNDLSRSAVVAFSKAIQLDPRFAQAYLMRASAYFELKQFSQAVADYDKTLELDKDNTTAYADRGLAKLQIGQYWAATIDLEEAIKRKDESDNSLSASYEYRADAFSKLGLYREAIENYSQAIKYQMMNLSFLISLKQFRGLYPEYDKVSDEELIRRINVLFWPQFDYDTMANRLLEKKNQEWQIGLIHELYQKRGDVYLRNGDYLRGVRDFSRIFKGIPNFASTIERWRLLGEQPGEAWYVDVKSTEFGSTPRLWAKFMEKNGNYTVQSFDFNCKERRIRVTSTVLYSKDEDLLNSSEAVAGWQRVIPDSRGEQMYNGMCAQ